MPLVRPPRRGCSPARLKLPSRRFGSCSLNGAPIGCPATGFFVARFEPPAFRDALVFLATLCLLSRIRHSAAHHPTIRRQPNRATLMPSALIVPGHYVRGANKKAD